MFSPSGTFFGLPFFAVVPFGFALSDLPDDLEVLALLGWLLAGEEARMGTIVVLTLRFRPPRGERGARDCMISWIIEGLVDVRLTDADPLFIGLPKSLLLAITTLLEISLAAVMMVRVFLTV